MDENNISQSATLQQEPRSSQKKLTPKWIIISCSILLAVVLVLVLFFIIKGNKQNEKETYALRSVKEIQADLLRPDSMFVNDVWVWDDREENSVVKVVVWYNAANKGGGITEGTCLAEFKVEEDEENISLDYLHSDSELELLDLEIKRARINKDEEALKKLDIERIMVLADNLAVEQCILEMKQKGISEEQDGIVVAIDSDKINALVS